MEQRKNEIAIFAAGCFWHVEEVFRKVPGVLETEVGYTGGDVPDPTYERVCGGDTGHAEALKVVFDPEVISYEELLHVFFESHDPTTKDRQGPDVGRQYRSAIFFLSDEQEKTAQKVKQEFERGGKFSNPIVTEIVPAGPFYKAEDYHQKYEMKQKGVL